MTPERWKQIEHVFHATLELSLPERAEFLDQACRSDDELRREVVSLLDSQEKATRFIESYPEDVVAGVMIAKDQQRSMIGRSLGRYRLRSLIGAGGMGEVYQASDARLNREVAVKILPVHLADNTEALKRFEREAKAVAALSHPNILAIHDLGLEQGVSYVVMELLEGETLRARLQRGALEWREAVEVSVAVTEGLEAAHAAGIIHRDLKPENIFLTSSGRVKVLDFGLALFKRVISEKTETAGPTMTETTKPGTVMGTVGYMSPEQVRGEEADAPSDIFAMGCVLYELISGQRPFTRGNSIETMAAILKEEPRELTKGNKAIPKQLERVIRHCLQKEPGRRYQSAHELAADLRAVTPGSGQSIKAPAIRQNKRGLLAALTTLALVTAIAGYFAWRSSRGSNPASEAGGILALPTKVYGSQENGFLTDAIPGTLSTHLAQVAGLETKVPPTSIEFERAQGDLGRVAELYGVTTCVVSSVSVEGDRIVLNVQLVEASSRRVRWSREYEGRRSNYIELARQAADGIRRVLRADSPEVTSGPSLAANSEAELAFRQGVHFWNRYNYQHQSSDFDLAFESLKRALDLDPKLADAAGHIATLFVFKFEAGAPIKESLAQAENWGRRAIEINPRCSKAWLARSYAAQFAGISGPSQNALEYALKAAFFGPQESMAQVALAAPVGSDALTLAASLEAHRLDPLYPHPALNAGLALQSLGRTAEGLQMVDEVLRFEPGMPFAVMCKTNLLINLGRLAEADDLMKQLEKFTVERRLPASFLVRLRHALALERRDFRSAELALSEFLKMADVPGDYGADLDSIAGEVVMMLAKHGKADLAFQLLNRVLDANGELRYDRLRLDPRLAPIRSDVRFQPILLRSRAQFDPQLKIMLQARSRGELLPYFEAALTNLIAKLEIK